MSDQNTEALGVLEKLGLTIAGKRDSAVKGRLASGIERFWEEDQGFYDGYDDANRHEFHDIKSKPTEGGRTVDVKKPGGSTLFPNITAPYVDAAAAKVSDMLMPGGDERNFLIEPTPVPDILDEQEGWPAIVPPAPAAAPIPMPAQGGAMAQMAQPQPATPAAGIMADPAAAAQDVDPLEAAFEKLKAIREKAVTAAEKTQEQIDDFLTECHYHVELRRVIEDAARLGTGVVKGPVPEKRKVKVWAKNPQTGERELVIKTETKPASKRIDLWNAFPDYPACGENIHDGSFFLERAFFGPKKLEGLKGGVGAAKYLDEQIDRVLDEGPAKNNVSASRGYHQQKELDNDDVFEVWYFYGNITGEELQAAGCDCEDKDKQYPVIVTMVNDRVIKASLNHLDSGEFPYDFMPWKARPGMPWGAGVARQARVGQRMVTAATRNLLDNAGAAARPHKVMTDDIEQDGDPWTWRASSETTDVSRAMMFFIQPSLQPELMNIIQLGEKMVEMHTGLPMIILGMQGNIEETAAGRALQNNNGSTVLRRIARNFDGNITEPHIRRYDQWLKIYSDDDAVKGDFQIRARGSSALVERDLQNQQVPTILNLSLNPAFEMDPALAADEFLKSQRFDPKAFKLSDKRKEELAKNAKPPVFPQIEAAKIRDAGDTQRAQLKLEHEARENSLDRLVEQMAIKVEAELGAAGLTSEERIALNQFKVDLAGITLKLNTQKQLSAMKGPQVTKPPTEPAGRAANGRAFEA
jgi:hypothetical protein